MWARMRYEYKSGEVIEVEVGSDTAAYPDAVSECVAGVLRLWAGAVATEGDA